MGALQVELVSADRLVWSGEASMIIARTSEGDVGVLPGHAPLLSVMVDGVIDVTTADGETLIAAVDAGFLSVADDRVSVLSERAELAADIDLAKAQADLEGAQAEGKDEPTPAELLAAAWADARIRAAEKKS